MVKTKQTWLGNYRECLIQLNLCLKQGARSRLLFSKLWATMDIRSQKKLITDRHIVIIVLISCGDSQTKVFNVQVELLYKIFNYWTRTNCLICLYIFNKILNWIYSQDSDVFRCLYLYISYKYTAKIVAFDYVQAVFKLKVINVKVINLKFGLIAVVTPSVMNFIRHIFEQLILARISARISALKSTLNIVKYLKESVNTGGWNNCEDIRGK